MTWNHVRRDEPESADSTRAEPPPAPVVVPGSLEWASAVGNQAVARLAEEEAGREDEAAEGGELGEEEAAGLADADEEQLPE